MKKFKNTEGHYLYIGYSREILSLYKNMRDKTELYPVFVQLPKVKDGKRYGIVARNQFFTIITAETCLELIVEEGFC